KWLTDVNANWIRERSTFIVLSCWLRDVKYFAPGTAGENPPCGAIALIADLRPRRLADLPTPAGPGLEAQSRAWLNGGQGLLGRPRLPVERAFPQQLLVGAPACDLPCL